MAEKENPIVFFDISIGGQPAGRMKMELFADLVPKTAENFRELICLNVFNSIPIDVSAERMVFLKDTSWRLFIGEVIKDFMVQGGDFVKGDGTGSTSIYGEKFSDENFEIKHTGPGLLSMANSGPNTNGCQCDFLDGKHVVFGKLIDGLLTLRKIENVSTGPGNRPKLPVVITECGQY
ncbi:9284_t:CDS:2 [Acaulospora colombiana]|uniref:9284_t:CDS:1 n=1 Tax=Acaulospora colombiana TaxID=27376 RepID=A0ACA9K8J8_9GLOM|nr:9284_t:CDS:2 [Acaulospora colombiana]